ncbi:MAG TPA: hypothetical protein VMY99_03355 [Nevskiaceae bacterium]|nr:hypothetical protein [Nevskiaceae bacterium]
MSALEQGVRLKTQAPDALQDIARPAGNALGEAACDFLSNEPGYAANLLCAADDLMNPKGVDPAIVSCATLQQEDALNGGAEGRVEIV